MSALLVVIALFMVPFSFKFAIKIAGRDEGVGQGVDQRGNHNEILDYAFRLEVESEKMPRTFESSR